MALNGLQEAIGRSAGWVPYVNSSLITPNWSNLLESCGGTSPAAQSLNVSRALHGNNFTLVWMLPGAPAKMGGKKEAAKRKQELSAVQLGLFIIFHLMLLVLRRKKRQGSKKIGCE